MNLRLPFIILVIAFLPEDAEGQVLNNGAHIIMTPGANIVLHNISLVNNGQFDQTSGTVKFTGNLSQQIGGSNSPRFHTLQIARQFGYEVQLQTDIEINDRIHFVTGNLELSNHNIYLLGNAFLSNEEVTRRVKGQSGGFIQATAMLNAPAAANPGNLGAFISSPANLGTVTIRRGHVAQSGSAGGSSIHRYYDINPEFNSSLNATLGFYYFDAERNNLAEQHYVLFKQLALGYWSEQGYSFRDSSLNIVEKSGIQDFSVFTISEAGNGLGVGECENMQVFYQDNDGDGYGGSTQVMACFPPPGYVAAGADCDDNDPDVHPGAPELCHNQTDDDCDGLVNEQCPVLPVISINDVTVSEGAGEALLSISLSQAAASPVRVQYSTVDGTATSSGREKDFRAVGNSSVTIPAGSTSADIAITIYPDTLSEPEEYFSVVLARPVGAQLGAGTATVTIMDGGYTRIKTATEHSEWHATVVPNPSRGAFELRITGRPGLTVQLRLMDANGRLLNRWQHRLPGPLSFGENLLPGIYFIEISQDEERRLLKLIRQ